VDLQDVRNALFHDEDGDSKGADKRNKICAILHWCFASYDAWALPEPIRNPIALDKGDVTESGLTKEFKGALKLFRTALAEQLREPRVVAEEPFTGRLMMRLFPKVVHCIENYEAMDFLGEIRKVAIHESCLWQYSREKGKGIGGKGVMSVVGGGQPTGKGHLKEEKQHQDVPFTVRN